MRSASPLRSSRLSTTGQRLQRGLLLQQRFFGFTRDSGSLTPVAASGIVVPPCPPPAFVERLNEQIGHEFAASQQYIAIAVYYDDETLPRLAAFFYAQALEERNHAMMMVQYLLDADADGADPRRRRARRRRSPTSSRRSRSRSSRRSA